MAAIPTSQGKMAAASASGCPVESEPRMWALRGQNFFVEKPTTNAPTAIRQLPIVHSSTRCLTEKVGTTPHEFRGSRRRTFQMETKMPGRDLQSSSVVRPPLAATVTLRLHRLHPTGSTGVALQRSRILAAHCRVVKHSSREVQEPVAPRLSEAAVSWRGSLVMERAKHQQKMASRLHPQHQAGESCRHWTAS